MTLISYARHGLIHNLALAESLAISGD